jgi:DNA-binding CsgD family transcriptional regulator
MPGSKHAFLSRRQHQCLRLVGKGLTSKEIARQLGLSPSTVDNHVRLAMDKLNVANRMEAADLVGTPDPTDARTIPAAVLAMKTIADSLSQIMDSLSGEDEA